MVRQLGTEAIMKIMFSKAVRTTPVFKTCLVGAVTVQVAESCCCSFMGIVCGSPSPNLFQLYNIRKGQGFSVLDNHLWPSCLFWETKANTQTWCTARQAS